MTDVTVDSPANRLDLRRWALAHGVSWEVHPLTLARDGRAPAHGQEVQVTCRAPDLEPGCPQCLEVYRRVHDLAELAIAVAHAQRVAHVRGYEPALRFRPTTGEMQPEIELAIELAPPEGEAEGATLAARCTVRLEKSLTELGARRH